MKETRPTRHAVDWAEIHRRLERTRQALSSEESPDADEVERILVARAQALAKPPAMAAAKEIDVIEFLIAGEHYGLEFAFVREVFPVGALTPLPCTPAFVLGIVNVRGEIVSVVDLRKFFELPKWGLSDLNKVVILQSDDMTFGILADEVKGVRSLPRSDLHPALPTLTGVREDYLLGVTGEPLIVLDAAQLLADPRMVVEETVEA